MSVTLVALAGLFGQQAAGPVGGAAAPAGDATDTQKAA